MKREIGSNFWLTEEEIKRIAEKEITPEIFGCKGSDFVWLSSGRSAISLVINTIEQRDPSVIRRVCVPAFTCNTVFEPFLKAGYEVIPIPVDQNLHISSKILAEHVKRNNIGIILLHNYFGFNTLEGVEQLIYDLKDKGITVIEDVTQCMYSSFNRLNTDYYVGSIRKWSGVPDGAFAVCSNGIFPNKPLKSDDKLEKIKIKASLLKHQYIEKGIGNKEDFLNLFREANDAIVSQSNIFKISPISYQIQANLDIVRLSEKRRENFTLLLNELKGLYNLIPVFKSLSKDESPLYLPILCENRLELQQILAKNDIYAPIIWPKGKSLPPIDNVTNKIYDEILCLPIDQRYGTDDILRMASIIKENHIWIGWMNWEQMKPYIDQIIDWQCEVTIKYHYPDKQIPRSFTEKRIKMIEQYLKEGNTFFLGIIKNNRLLGYYWAYISDFLFERTWNEQSSYLSDEVRGMGLGLYMKKLALAMAIEKGCVAAKSMYAPFNKPQEHLFEKLGYYISRVEVTKKL